MERTLRTAGYEGEIPAGLNGAFYRVQPDPQFPPRLGDDIAFNGDGMITRFHIHDGKVDFRQRWAQTDKWKLEKAAGKGLFGAYRNPLTDDESVQGAIRSTAWRTSGVTITGTLSPTSTSRWASTATAPLATAAAAPKKKAPEMR